MHAHEPEVVPHCGFPWLLDEASAKILLRARPLLLRVVAHANAEVRVGIVGVVLQYQLRIAARQREVEAGKSQLETLARRHGLQRLFAHLVHVPHDPLQSGVVVVEPV